MKLFKSIISRYTFAAVAGLGLSMSFTSCESINDYPDDCGKMYVQFVYDMNMKFADAFSNQVTSVDLYVFDATTGAFVKKYTENGTALQTDGYRMEVDLQPGNYELIAWCGLNNNKGHFTVSSNVSANTDVHCTMARTKQLGGNATQNDNLTPLFHGIQKATFTEVSTTDQVAKVYLTKNTNNVVVSLQHVSGYQFDPSEFTISMTDCNGSMAHDNSLKADENIVYSPWHYRSALVDMSGEARATDGDAKPNFLMAELSTARLTTGTDPQLTVVHNETGNTVFQIPVTQWALLFKSANHSSMEDQEYLDREDNYNLMLYLGNSPEQPEDPEDPANWVGVQVIINGWHVIDDTVDSM